MAGQLALGTPQIPINIKYPAAKEVPEYLVHGLPLREVDEVILEHVLHVLDIGGDHSTRPSEAAHDDGFGGRGREELRIPIQQAMAVLIERQKTPNDWVRWRSVNVKLLMFSVVVAEQTTEHQEETKKNKHDEEAERKKHDAVWVLRNMDWTLDGVCKLQWW